MRVNKDDKISIINTLQEIYMASFPIRIKAKE